MAESEVIEPPAASAPVFPPFPSHPRMLGPHLILSCRDAENSRPMAKDRISGRPRRPWQAACWSSRRARRGVLLVQPESVKGACGMLNGLIWLLTAIRKCFVMGGPFFGIWLATLACQEAPLQHSEDLVRQLRGELSRTEHLAGQEVRSRARCSSNST